MIKWKIVVGSAGFGMLLSLLTGAISGVPIGALLIRALMWSALFACLGAALSFAISRYLPELFAIVPGSDKDDAEKGQTVDLVLPDENPHTYTADDLNRSEEDLDELDERGSSISRDEPSERVSNTLVEEVEELGPGDEGLERAARRPAASEEEHDEDSSEELPELDDGDALAEARAGALRARGELTWDASAAAHLALYEEIA